MSFEIKRVRETSEFELHFFNEPDNVLALKQDALIAPTDFDFEWWVFVQIGIWNNFERKFLQDLLSMSKNLKYDMGIVAVAVYEESAFHPPQFFSAPAGRSPTWALLHNQKVVYEDSGLVDLSWLETLMHRLRAHYVPR